MGDLGATFAGIVTDGSLLLAIAVAAMAGLISFVSPCVFPLIPNYLGYVSGLTGASATGQPRITFSRTPSADGSAVPGVVATAPAPTRSGRRRVLAGALLFISGFSFVFVSYGALFGGIGRLLLQWAPLLTRVMGVITIVMGLIFLGALPWLQRERRIHRRPPAGLVGAPVLGVVFGLGWTPCLGPTLSAVNTLAYNQASAARGAVLGLPYCMGLGIPFLLFAMGAHRALTFATFARSHARTVMRVGGVLLIGLGLLLVTGRWDAAMMWLRSWLAATGVGTSVL